MKNSARWLILFLLLTGFSAGADQLQEAFTSNGFLDSANTTAVWNFQTHYIHPPLAVTLTDNVNNEDSLNADVGNGGNGAFDVSTYANFSVGGVTPNNVITINTNTFPVLNFTYFNLASGWQIQGAGTNPLWIKVLGNVTISGTIDCSGTSGDNVSTATTTVAAGGTGRCGGGNGGAGATQTIAAQSGTSGGTGSTGGSGGTSSATGTGGGGGGGFSSYTGSNGYIGGSTTGGASGTSTTDPTFTVFGTGQGGGSGGGGGGYATNGYRGGGGGAGGGVIRITAGGNITINATGSVLARSGSGGGGGAGAGGGGGGGGGIWFQTPGTINNLGTIDASANVTVHNGGVSTNNGGFGTNGRTWLLSQDDVISGNTESPQSDRYGSGPCFCNGEVHYSVASYTAQTLPYDLANTAPLPQLVSLVTSLPGTSTVSVLVAGSSDGFVHDDTGFQTTANLATLNGKRYVRFKLTLQLVPSGFASSPLTINSINLTYNGHVQNNFNFNTACGYLGTPGEFLTWGFLFFALYFFTNPSRRKRVLGRHRKLWASQ